MKTSSKISVVVISIFLTLLYGYVAISLFTNNSSGLEAFSWSFILLVPYAIGALGITILIRKGEVSLKRAIFQPWLYCVGLFIVATVFSPGFLLCIIIGLPIFLPAASSGGVTAWILHQYPKATKIVLLLVLISPFAANPVEAQFNTPTSITTTYTFVDIDANAAVVWDNIKSILPISELEQNSNWLHWLGLPRPIAASLSHEGIGGVRQASWENGLRFDEMITEWEPQRRLSFSVTETSEDLLPPPLNLIDGERFDVLQGSYVIEPLSGGTVRLHLATEHYLGTRFNKYGSWWTDQIMRNLQNYILEVVKIRAEGEG
jgi:hypothetical protein